MSLFPTVREGDWTQNRKNWQKAGSLYFGPRSAQTFAELTLTGLTASQLLQTDTNKKLTSIALPLIVSKGGTGAATLTDHGILLGSGTDVVTALGAATHGQLPIGSTGADPVLATITGTANQITVTNAAGSITLSGPQNLHTGATPEFTGLTLSGLTAGRIPFAGTGGLISHDASLLWDNSTKIFGIRSTDASDLIQIYHNNVNAYFRWTGDEFHIITDEGTNTSSSVNILGKGTGTGWLYTYDENDEEWAYITCTNGIGKIGVSGTSPQSLSLVSDGEVSISMFASSSSGETQELQIWGYKSGDSPRSLEIGVGVDAADTASFDGVSYYLFDGTLLPNAVTTTGIIDASAGKVLVEDSDTDVPTGESDGYVGVAKIGDTARIYFAVDGAMYCIDGTVCEVPVTGNPIGLLLVLTYA